MEETISLKEIFATLRKHVLLIVTITLLGVMISAGVTFFLMTPKYDASTQILVNQANANSNSLYQQANTVQTNVQLVNTYSVIINNPAVLNQVIKKLNLNLTTDELKNMLTVSTAQNSQVFTLTAETDSPAQSVRIVNGVAAAFKSQVQKVMNVDNVSILSPANVASSLEPVKPKATINLAIAFVVSLMVSVGLAFLLEYMDNTIKTEEDIEKILDLPVLGFISEIKDGREPSNGKSRSTAHTAGRHQLRGAGHVETK
ncbi:YveK family protein [Sporolactobacillus laevolacticus]|uniref:Capsular polysaccharide biosynthesis protein n=1 Tax=Sporolactobacillus laevolacticus DSM 442 TaxID=1395513 RepID=V6J0J3_9BACL|nr:Wzz/FepE/Etk N-terminal domain-containing protein [Sporolactobacillus laevolacticus]EST12661.1 capsular polysaccharide biosynthesis protein [Sporolactobacillus laevolacticus DSM 442]